MIELRSLRMLLLFVSSIYGLSLQKEQSVLIPLALSPDDECDPSVIPVMKNFDMKLFSGPWYELAKSASGFIEVNDGMWKIRTTNDSNTFLFSGRDDSGHCIRPIKGKIYAIGQTPGTLTLRYQTYSTHVEETLRILYTDYTSIAVIYLCMHHFHNFCHPAGLMGAVWTRRPHVDRSVYDEALRYLEMACVHKTVPIVRNRIGPCTLDDLGFQIDDFPAPNYCYQPLDIGYCRGSIQRYHYDPKRKSCEMFSYSGCGGNRNNFMSEPECRENCISEMKEPICTTVSKCALHCPPCCSEGRDGCVACNCEDIIIEDNFGNCVKNPANCPPTCAVEELFRGCYRCSCKDENEPFLDTPACLEVKAAGHCSEKIDRYYFDAVTRECEPFIYTGCKGNKNNFETLEKCLETCQVADSSTFKSPMKEEGDRAAVAHYNGWVLATVMVLCTFFV